MPRPPVAQGRLVHDLRGQIAAKLDQCMKSANAPWDIEYSAMLETFGGLTRAKDDPGNKEPWPYENIEGRAGYNVPPGLVFDTPKPLPPEGLAGMVGSQAWKSSVFNDTLFDWQSSLMQLAGGMDMFWKGFLARTLRNNPARKVGSLIVYNAAVRGIDIRDRKVEVAVSQSGRNRMETADYCVSTIPMPIFTALKTNIDAAVMTAARALKPVPAGKVGWQAERFWEKEYHIFGGISWVQGLASQVWYPSDAFLSRLGVLTGAYMNAAPAARFNAMPIAQRMDVSRAAIDGLHPGAGKLLRHGVAIGWNNMEHLKMGWIDENDDAFVENAAIAARPVANRLFQAGDQLTRLSGWQEGAILMARKAIADIVQATRGG